MVTLLRKLFIKNYKDVDDPNVRNAHGLLGAVFGLVSNALLIVFKLTAAFLLASSNNWVFPVALIAEAVNNVSDLGSSFVTLFAFLTAKKRADKEHPFGHKRAEYVAGLIVATLVVVAGARLLFESITGAFAHTPMTYDLFAFVVLGVAIVLKGVQGYVNRTLGKTIHSKALELTALDSLLDVFASTVVLVCGLIARFSGFPYLDPYAGMAVSLLILFSGTKAVKEAVSPLLGTAYPKEIETRCASIAQAHPEVLGIHDFLAHEYGPGVLFLSFHAEMDETLPLKEAHEVIDAIEKEIAEAIGASVTIHVDPIQPNDERLQKLQGEIAAILKDIDPRIRFHECHLRDDGLYLDIEIPFAKDQSLAAKIEDSLKRFDLPLHIAFEHSYAQEND